MAFAGFFVNLSRIPAVLRWLQWLSPLKYALEALSVNEVSSGLMIVDELAGAKVQVSATVIMETLFGFQFSAYYRYGSFPLRCLFRTDALLVPR